MRRRIEVFLLIGLVALLGVVLAMNRNSGSGTQADLSGSGTFRPLGVEDPKIRFDLLAKKPPAYAGLHRNIFTAVPPPLAAKARTVARGYPATEPQLPPPPPPVEIPLTFFGYETSQFGHRRVAFFAASGSDDVFLAHEGDTLLNRFRLLRITPNTAEFEEISSGRKATLMLTEQSPSS